MEKADEVMIKLIKDSASENMAVASKASAELGLAIAEEFKEALFPTDLHSDLFQIEFRGENDDVRYPTDLIAVGREREFKAYTAPRWGEPGYRIVEQDYLRVAVADYVNHIEVPLVAMRQGDYNAMARAMEILLEGVNMTMNDVCWETLIAAACGRGFQVTSTSDDITDYGLGALPKSLISRMQTKAKRASNASSRNHFEVTRAYMSPELRETVTNWDNSKIDEWTRSTIVTSESGNIERIYNCELVSIDELGTNATASIYQNSAVANHGFTFSTSGGTRTELVIGVDTRPQKRKLFVMPVTRKPTVIDDSQNMRRRGLASWLMEFSFGAGILDNRVTLPGEC